ncbi:MAG: ATP-dependent Clp protease proteolytic subunit [Prevotella sp.]|nr:ATP-dependent Clp protease proteolytic subunit [Prevotella sp.]
MQNNMATKNNYQLHLKGFVGGYDFDADYVDYVLSKNEGKEVHVLIDSLGGKSNTALSIFSAFKRHGNVNVHFVGMNASAATIASLGARHITMDSSAMYLVHKCSVGFFEWGNMNADDLQTLIAHIEAQKKDLDKLDANIAQMYAARCHKDAGELLALMKVGGWLTAQEALAWGFVDELTDYEDESAPILTDTMAQAMASAGIPIPDLPRTSNPEQSAIVRFFNSLASFFTGTHRSNAINDQMTNIPNNPSTMNKVFTRVCAILAYDHLESNEGRVTLADSQLDILEAAINADKQSIHSLNEQVQALTAAKQQLESSNQQLQSDKQQLESDKLQLQTEMQSLTDSNTQLQAEIAELKEKPADTSSQIVSDKNSQSDTTGMQSYFNTRCNARRLFEQMP